MVSSAKRGNPHFYRVNINYYVKIYGKTEELCPKLEAETAKTHQAIMNCATNYWQILYTNPYTSPYQPLHALRNNRQHK